MKSIQWAVAVLIVGAATAAWGAGPRNVSFESRLRLGYNDNVDRVETGREGSTTVTAEAGLTGVARFDTTFLSLRYRAGLRWFDDRRADGSVDWTHSVDFAFDQAFSRRFSLSLSDAFRYVDRPEILREDGTIERRDSTYIYNTLNGTFSSVLTTRVRLDLTGRYVLLRYDEDVLAEREDYDTLAGGLTLRGQLAKATSGFLDGRVERTDYMKAGRSQVDPIDFPGAPDAVRRRVPDRSADTFSLGVGGEHVFDPNLVGLLRVGVTHKEYSAANTGSSTGPYVETNLTIAPSPVFRVAVGGSYSLFQSSLVTFANQRRTAGTLRLGHDVTPRLQVNLTGSVIHSRYDEDESVRDLAMADVTGGDELAYSVGARMSLRLGRRNMCWLEAGWTYTDLDSDLRDDYRQNVVDVAWRFRL